MKISLNERDIKAMLFNYFKQLNSNLKEDDINFYFENSEEKYINILINMNEQKSKDSVVLQDLLDKVTYQKSENEKERREKINELRKKGKKLDIENS